MMNFTNIFTTKYIFKTILIYLFTFFLVFGNLSNKTNAQSINLPGLWTGVLEFGDNKLDVAYKIEKKGSGYYSQFYVPAQTGEKGLVMSKTVYEKNQLHIISEQPKLEFIGKTTDSNHIVGTYVQNDNTYRLILTKTWNLWPIPKPQTPVFPFSFTQEEVVLYTAEGRIKLAGSINKPDTIGKFPLVILFSGSGAQDRDSRIGQHKPFLLLTDKLTKAGFAVLRFDDRGAGKTTGHPEYIQSTTTLDLVKDATTMIQFAKNRIDIDSSKIFLLGHSEGAQIVSITASKNKDIAGIIMLAGPAISGKETNLMQNEYVLKSQHIPKKNIRQFLQIHGQLLDFCASVEMDETREDSMLKAIAIWEKSAKRKSKQLLYNSKDKDTEKLLNNYKSFSKGWWKTYLKLDISESLEMLQQPVLAMNGDKDVQVDSKINLNEIKDAFNKSGNTQTEVVEWKGLNHLFQQCKTCDIKEYYNLEETMNERVLLKICDWLISQNK